MTAGPAVEAEKPKMMTEAARKIPVPAWWGSGTGTTVSEATMTVERLKRNKS